MLTYIFFIVGFFVLIKGADLLVEGSSAIARRFKISDIVIGLTVVSFGTSAPELVVNISAGIRGNTDIAIGNILGSNIANILLILGVSAIICPLAVERNTAWKEIPISLFGIGLTGMLANDALIGLNKESALDRIDGFVLILFFGAFMWYIFRLAKEKSAQYVEDSKEIRFDRLSNSVLYIVMGLIGLIMGGEWIVAGAVRIAAAFGMSESLIGITIVAVGTSLPELATSAIAAYKKEPNIAIGNAIGSNIFNIFWILGISSIIRPLPFRSASNIDVAAVISASILLFVFLFIGKRFVLKRWQGAAFIIAYIAYIVFSILKDQAH